MDKKQVQQRVLQNGKPLALSKFEWCEKSRTFSTYEDNCVIDFNYIDNCTFKTGSGCTFNTGWDCTFNTGPDCTFNTAWGCTFKTGPACTFKTNSDCTFDTGPDCTFKTGPDCTFETGWRCTFNTAWDCTFKTGWDCTFDTGAACTFDTGAACTFKTGSDCVIVRRDIFTVIQPKKDETIQLCPRGIKGYLVNGTKDGEPHIIADGILSKVLKNSNTVTNG